MQTYPGSRSWTERLPERVRWTSGLNVLRGQLTVTFAMSMLVKASMTTLSTRSE